MIQCLIFDDEQASIDIIKSLCGDYSSQLEVIGCASSIERGIELIETTDPDLIFLDIEFPEGLGFEILQAFPDRVFHTVFITAFEEYALTAIKHYALDYILKPMDHEDFSTMMDRVIHQIQDEKRTNKTDINQFLRDNVQRKIGIPDSSGMIYLNPSEIVYVKADGSYSEVHVVGGQVHVVSRILKRFEDVLTDSGFFRTHRKYLVNLEHVRSFSRKDGGIIILDSAEQIPVARKEKERVIALLARNATSI